ncbi:MAG: hypothetical protein AAGH78_00430 [Cyanobacteria bacterium P01_H01_bin.58]
MPAIQRIRCPNCGNFAERQVLSDCQAPECDYVVQTTCEACDYLMIMGFPAGKVLEAYAPGQAISVQHSPEDKTPCWMKPQGLMSTCTERKIQFLNHLFSRTS